MKMGFAMLFWMLCLVAGLQAQCESCPAVPGEMIDHCYCEPGDDTRCVQFTQDSPSFYFQNKSLKKGNPFKFDLPADLGPVTVAYLMGLQADKKIKLTAMDYLVIERGIEQWRQIEGMRTWRMDIINSGFGISPTGLAYKEIIKGNGLRPKQGQKLIVHYTGYLADGKKFDSSLDRKHTFEFVLGKNQVIAGWEEGFSIMNVGSRYLLRIPPELGYGPRGAGKVIPPNAVLFFDVRLIAIE
jgi:hypothetical protein